METGVDTIIGQMALQYPFDLNDLTKSSWVYEIQILKRELREFPSARIFFEFRATPHNAKIAQM